MPAHIPFTDAQDQTCGKVACLLSRRFVFARLTDLVDSVSFSSAS